MNIIEDANKFFKSLRDDKNTMMFLIVTISVITVWLKPPQIMYDLFNNTIFKFVIFIIISFISNENPAIAVMLTIFVLTTLQIVTYNNLSKHEQFKQSGNIKSNFEDYMSNPLLTQDKLNPITSNLNLKVENPDQIYKNMITKGRVLLNDSMEMNDDLDKRGDFREKQIYEVTKRDGINLIESGLNRLQVSDQGEYKINKNINNNKFVKYDNLLKNYINDPQIMSAFNELKYSFNKLQSDTLSKNNTNNFNEQLDNVYESEIQLLELIYKNKKNDISVENQTEINNIFNNIKNIKLNKNIMDKYPILLENIKILVEYLS
jgi:hypothetical protein